MHPTVLVRGKAYKTEFRTSVFATGIKVNADSTPTYTIRKNGSANGDSLTLTNPSTGLYSISYDPSGEVEGDFFSIDIAALISTVEYNMVINFTVTEIERGTDGANTTTPPTAVDIRQEIDNNSAQLSSIKGYVDDIGAAGAGLTSLPWNAAWDTEFAEILAAYGTLTYPQFVLRSLSAAEYTTLLTDASDASDNTTSILNKIGAFAGSGLNTILGFLRAIMRKDVTVPGDVGGTYDSANHSLEAAADAIANLGNLGTGTYSIALTVTDGTDPVHGAHVSLSAVGQTTRSGATDENGLITFSSDGDVTWEVTITAGGGLTYTPSTIAVVSTNVTQTLEMTPYVIDPPAAPNLATGTLLCLGDDGLPEEDVSIYFRLVRGPEDDGYAYDSAISKVLSDENGIVSKDMVRGAYYTVRRGLTGEEVRFLVPDSDTFNIAELFGAP